jgi:hypothetical protein
LSAGTIQADVSHTNSSGTKDCLSYGELFWWHVDEHKYVDRTVFASDPAEQHEHHHDLHVELVDIGGDLRRR